MGFALGSSSGGLGQFSSVTDNGDGTYSATFTGILAGSNTITATIGGVAVTTSLPSITITPGPVSLSKSLLSLSLPSVQLGGESTITLQAEDVNGNKETAGGQTVAFKLADTSGGQGSISSVTDNQNGTYTATFIGTADGSNGIEATIGGSPLTSAAPTISVATDQFSLAKSFVTVLTGTVQSGNTTTVTLQAEDAKGIKETSGGLTVLFKLGSPAGGQGTFSSVTDNDNGTYTATFTGILTGSNTIKATIDGQTISTRAPAIKVNPGPDNTATSIITLSASNVAAGRTVTVTLQPEDAAGNKLNLKGLAVQFAPGSANGGQGTFSAAKYNPNGTYTATFTGTIEGGNTITATVNGQAVTTHAPPVITVTPGTASPAKSFIGLSSGTVVAGSTITVTLQAVDAYGNYETTGGSVVSFKLVSTSGSHGVFSSVKDNKNGTYTSTFTGTISGNNAIVAMIGTAKITTAAPTITVTPGPVSLAKSVVTLSAPSVQPGSTIKVTLQAADVYGNKETIGGLLVAFALSSNEGGQGTFGSVTDNHNGTYTAMFAGTVAGSNSILAMIDGVKVTSIEPSVKVT